MCGKCNKNSCNGCSSGSSSNSNSSTGNSQTDAVLAELQDQVDTLTHAVKAFTCGHPILLISKDEDIQQFNSDGLGSLCWDGWGICNGKSYTDPVTKKPFVTPNFTDRFIVQAGGAYALGDVGGEDAVVLTTPQLPAHNHTINDPGHIHDITDPGHVHPIQDDMHTHQAVNDPHNHHAALSMGSHQHNFNDTFQDDVNIGFIAAGPLPTQGFLNSSTPGEVTVASAAETYQTELTDGGTGGTAEGYVDNATQQTTISPAATGIEVLSALTGIDNTASNTTGITTNSEGSDEAHNNLPPYFAAFYVIKMW